MQKVDLFQVAKSEYGCHDPRQGLGMACNVSDTISSLIRDEIEGEQREHTIDRNIWNTYGFQYTDCPNDFALEMIFEIYIQIRLHDNKREEAHRFLQQYSSPDPVTYTTPQLTKKLIF